MLILLFLIFFQLLLVGIPVTTPPAIVVTGEYVLMGLGAGIYSSFSVTLNGCEYTSPDLIDLNNPGAPV